MPRVGIYVPITLNEQFINMIYFLARSIEFFSGLKDYKIICTVSRDGMTDLASPLLHWTKDCPIEFRFCEANAWNSHAKRAVDENKRWFQYAATLKQQMASDFDEDVVVFMDADTLVCGPLTEMVGRSAQERRILARPAWQPPAIDLARALRERGCPERDYGLEYAGYGWAFMEPRACPPYFNFGVFVMPGDIARLLRDNIGADGDFVEERFYDTFAAQIALCLFICRLKLGYDCLEEKYNFGNGDTLFKYPIHPDPKIARQIYERSASNLADLRVIHYVVQLPEFSKSADMASWENVLKFCDRQTVGVVNTKIRNTFRTIIDRRTHAANGAPSSSAAFNSTVSEARP